MTLPREDDLLVRLLSRGTISLQDLRDLEEDLAQARTLVMAGASQERRITWLLQKGRISREDLVAAQGAVQASPDAPPPVRPAVADRSTSDRLARSRYRVMGLLGEGGMGKVYKAHDRKLDRYVAMKFLQASDPETAERFQREAQSQARIEHPAICKVYEVGEMDRRPYIAMQYIDGRTLKGARAEMTLEQKVQVMRTAAEAAHEAHRIGIIHRDLNPSNIMVERSEAGAWMPYLMDFGLAKEMAGPGLTQDGTAAGTPYYMSPEQAAGDIQKLDRRTDIYALGATLYELVVGAPPFEGVSVIDVLDKVIHAEAVPLRRRDASLPEDLESIVMKCLEKEPQRRYDSARALAEDLGRFLDGEPVRARPANLLYRLRKKAGKNKLAVGIGGIALLALLTVSSLWLGERWAAGERAALAQQFGREVQELESILRYAHMMPLHAIAPERKLVEARMDGIRRRMKELGALAEGPGHYALGRGHLALDRPEEALRALNSAWESGAREPAVAAVLGRTLARVYQERLPEAEGIRNAELRAAKVKELGDRFRRPALEYLKAGAEATSDAPEYGEALLALLDRRWDSAVLLAGKALERIPWMYEAHRLQGEAFASQARSMEAEGKFKEAEGFLGRARDAFDRAVAVAPSDPALYGALVELHASRMRLAAAQGLSQEAAYAEACGTAHQALEADATFTAVHDSLSYIEWMVAASERGAGKDPRPALDRAEAAARRALALEPDRAGALNHLGLSFVTRAEWQWDNGHDPVPHFEDARKHYERALAIEPGNIVVLNNLGNIHSLQGEYARSRGGDPEPHIERAIRAYRTALQIHPAASFLHNNLGNSWAFIGERRIEQGKDPGESLAEAERHHREAVRIKPNYSMAWINLGYDLSDRARWAIKSGGDPEIHMRQSLEASAAALEINPSSPTANQTAGIVHLDWAEWEADRGVDPRLHLESARSFLVRSLAFNAADTYALANLGVAWHATGRWAYAKGGDPGPALRKAEACFSQALEIDPTYSFAFRERGWVRLDLALQSGPEWKAGKSATALGETDFRKALELNPKDPLTCAGLARALLARGPDAFGEARKLAGLALELDPLEVEAVLSMAGALADGGAPDEAAGMVRKALVRRPGSVRLLMAMVEIRLGRTGGAALDGEGREALRKVLAVLPEHPRALALSSAKVGGK